jgi:hypothetical protein
MSTNRCGFAKLLADEHTNFEYSSARSALVYLFAVGPAARAVLPSPDGGYACGNTAEGTDALFSLTTGVCGTRPLVFKASTIALGFGGGGTAVGAGALRVNTTSDAGTAVGGGALANNTTGGSNTALGAGALFNSTSGSYNIAIGDSAGRNVATEATTVRLATRAVLFP